MLNTIVNTFRETSFSNRVDKVFPAKKIELKENLRFWNDYTYFFQMKRVRREFKANVKIHLFVRERTLVFRDWSTPAREILNQKKHFEEKLQKN